MYLFIICYLSVFSVGSQTLIFSMVYNTLLHLSILGRLSQMWPVGIPSSWFLCPCDTPQHSLSTSLLSGITSCSRLILYPPCPSLGISHFSKELGVVCLVLRVLHGLLQICKLISSSLNFLLPRGNYYTFNSLTDSICL